MTDRLDVDAARIIDWLLKEYVNAYSRIPVVWDQEHYDEGDRVRAALELRAGVSEWPNV